MLDSINRFAKAMDAVYSDINISESLMVATSKLQEIGKLYEPFYQMQNQQFAELFASEQLRCSLKVLQQYDKMTTMTTALGRVSESVTKLYGNAFETWQQYDFSRLSEVLHDVLVASTSNKVMDVEEVVDEVAEAYITDISEQKEEGVCLSIEEKRAHSKEIRDWIGFWISIISFFITIYSLVSTTTTNTYNTTVQVNNYYVNELEIDAEILNAMSYRIVTENNVLPRVKPDCSSRVTGCLGMGQVVTVSDKYRKWVKINWKDAEGNSCSGWIQNYKLIEFK